jgi:hypothetical protein
LKLDSNRLRPITLSELGRKNQGKGASLFTCQRIGSCLFGFARGNVEFDAQLSSGGTVTDYADVDVLHTHPDTRQLWVNARETFV